MVSLITASHSFFISRRSVPVLNSLPLASRFLEINPDGRRGFRRKVAYLDIFVAKENCFLGLAEVRRGSRRGSSWCCWCKGWEENDGDDALEAEILEFMKISEKPEVFPTKKELVNAGRMDLVDSILKKGGWLSLGWDSDDENDEKEEFTRYSESVDFNIGDFQDRVESLQESNSFKEAEVASTTFSQLASRSGRSLDMTAQEDTGIEGILNRLEKERKFSFGINLGGNGYQTNASSNYDGDHKCFGNIAYAKERADLRKNGRLTSEMWRTWSIQRAGFTDTEFEAAEICFNEDQMEGKNENSQDERLAITGGDTEALDGWKEINHNQIQTRLQHLELELASALRLLRSKSEEITRKDHECTSSDLQKLSDAWEFQENEFMNAHDKLRSIRAKLAILDGKMALAIIDAQKIVEDKQKRIDGTRRALQLLRTACIVWPNSASEVLLTGSFDGWTTQRKMEKSRTGIFSVCLKLYPGRYEIKFIVDGIWRIDPLRPIVHDSGYENNLLLIT